jgi:2-C-methyl-D-erythritol 2,4-cyclodiphosphate synthase/2-C-methyl-D-erythritol 4-phosphate cytidylyltransferase
MGGITPKACLPLDGRPMFCHSLETALSLPWATQVLLMVPSEQLVELRDFLAQAAPEQLGRLRPGERGASLLVEAGGIERQDSVRRALGLLDDDVGWVVVHDAARPFASPTLFDQVLEAAWREGAATAALRPTDALRWLEPLARKAVYLPRGAIIGVQTPQAFRRDLLEQAHALSARRCRPISPQSEGSLRSEEEAAAPDDASLLTESGQAVALVPGENDNFKITHPEDWERACRLARARARAASGNDGETLVQTIGSRLIPRVGHGYDIHRLTRGSPLCLSGLELPGDRGLVGHSDADVACHALADALLGAVGLGDLGEHFPQGAPEWLGASGPRLLAEVARLVNGAGYEIGNLDVTILAEKPRVAPFRQQMRQALADALGVQLDRVSVKAATNEGLGPVGSGVCLAAYAVVLCLPLHPRAERVL